MTYRWQNPDAQDGHFNVKDMLGGRWDYTNHGPGGFTLDNRDNGNTIKYLGTRQ